MGSARQHDALAVIGVVVFISSLAVLLTIPGSGGSAIIGSGGSAIIGSGCSGGSAIIGSLDTVNELNASAGTGLSYPDAEHYTCGRARLSREG